jgi:hypothetical protein
MNRLDAIFSAFFFTFVMFLMCLAGHIYHNYIRNQIATIPLATTTTTTTATPIVNNNNIHNHSSFYSFFLTSTVACFWLVGSNNTTFALTLIYTLCKIVDAFLYDTTNLNHTIGKRVTWYISNAMILGLYINSFVGYGYLKNDNNSLY